MAKQAVPKHFQRIWDSSGKIFASFEGASNQPKGVVTLFYNDGDIAIGIERNGFEYYFREDWKATKGEHAGEPIDQKTFKLLLPVNQSLTEILNPKSVPVLIQMVGEHRAEQKGFRTQSSFAAEVSAVAATQPHA